MVSLLVARPELLILALETVRPVALAAQRLSARTCCVNGAVSEIVMQPAG